MPRIWKKFKKYEKGILLGLTILLLASFNVAGVIKCSRTPAEEDFGGSFEVSPGKRESVSSEDFTAAVRRYGPFYNAPDKGGFGIVTLRYASERADKDAMTVEQATWAHLATVAAAKAAGYRVGEDELAEEIKRFVVSLYSFRRGGRGALTFTQEIYDQIVQNYYHGGTKADFELTFREILLKDKFLSPMIDAEHFSKSRAEAYKSWKAKLERVNLKYVAAPAGQFRAAVELEEATRTAVSKQEGLLQRVSSTAMRVRQLEAYITDTWAHAHGGALPKDEEELKKDPAVGPLSNEDGWSHPLHYRFQDAKALVTSDGPDGLPGTPDDVGPETVKNFLTLVALRETADALLAWHKATKSWPEKLDKLTTKPDEKSMPPLHALSKDGWGQDLSYVTAGEGPVTLASLGADGKSSGDDVPAEFQAETATVRLPHAFDVYLLGDLKDAWGHPLSIQFKSTNPWRTEVASAGPDGVFGNDDDVRGGNAIELSIFFQHVQRDYMIPVGREFEAIWVHLPLVPDEAFKALWARFEKYRPKEQDAYDRWRSNQGPSAEGSYYVTEEMGEGGVKKEFDPADPVKGHGADLIPKKDGGGAPAAGDFKGWLVPAPDTLGDQKDPPPPPAPAANAPPPPEDPLRKIYLEKGWRRIVLRELFFNELLKDILTRASDSWKAHEKWIADGKRTQEPALVGFPELLAEFREFAPGAADVAAGARFLEHFQTEKDKPLSRPEWEALPGVGDYDVTANLNPLVKDGEYLNRPPIVTKKSAGCVILRNVKFHPERLPDLDEVIDKVRPKYLDSKAMDRAQKELDDLKKAAQAPGARLEDLAKERAEKGGWKYATGETGMFVGSVSQSNWSVPPKASAEEALAIRQRSYARKYGYGEVEATQSGQDAVAAKPGDLGRRVLRDEAAGDDATGCAYLVQVVSREDPDPDEFSGRRYLEWLREAAYGKPQRDRSEPVDTTGFMPAVITKYFDEYDTAKHLFGIQTNRDPSTQKYGKRK